MTAGAPEPAASPNLALRAARPDDYALVKRWLDRPATHRWLDPVLRGDRFDQLHYQLLLARPASHRLHLGLLDGVPAAITGLTALDPDARSGELWYALGPPELAGRGVTTAAVARTLELAFGTVALRTIRAAVAEGNVPSERLLRRLGFRAAGRWRASFPFEGGWRDRLWFDLTFEEWVSRAEGAADPGRR